MQHQRYKRVRISKTVELKSGLEEVIYNYLKDKNEVWSEYHQFCRNDLEKQVLFASYDSQCSGETHEIKMIIAAVQMYFSNQ